MNKSVLNLEGLKGVMDSAVNKNDVQALINQFDSEEQYWDYQYEVYKKIYQYKIM